MPKKIVTIFLIVFIIIHVTNGGPFISTQGRLTGGGGIWESRTWRNVRNLAMAVVGQNSIFRSNQHVARSSFATIETTERPMIVNNFLGIIQQVFEAVCDFFKRIFITWQQELVNSIPVEAFMSTRQIVKRQGYPLEEHKVPTEDGYVLTLYRIPSEKKGDGNNTKFGRPVVIQHGLLCSSNEWLLLPQNDSLPFMLANQGYDVWIPNFRGNNFSMSHERLKSFNLKYWNFGIDELGSYDVPAIVDHVLKKTEYDSLDWVGHSMGCVTLYIAVNKDPSLNDKIRKMVALSPAVYVKHLTSPMFKFLSPLPSTTIRAIGDALSAGRFLPPNMQTLIHNYGPYFCTGRLTSQLCRWFAFSFAGANPKQVTKRALSMIGGHVPAVASMKTLAHYAQYVRRGIFEAFDYGEEENLKRYNSTEPAQYDLSIVRFPVIVFYGLNDRLTATEDVKKTISLLGNVQKSVEVPDPEWTHLDFLYAADVKKLVYEPAIEFLNS